MRIRVTTRAELFEKRKEGKVDGGYRIEENGRSCERFCSFVVCEGLSASLGFSEPVARALNHDMRARDGTRSGDHISDSAKIDSLMKTISWDAQAELLPEHSR
jgi:hypothetical protein